MTSNKHHDDCLIDKKQKVDDIRLPYHETNTEHDKALVPDTEYVFKDGHFIPDIKKYADDKLLMKMKSEDEIRQANKVLEDISKAQIAADIDIHKEKDDRDKKYHHNNGGDPEEKGPWFNDAGKLIDHKI